MAKGIYVGLGNVARKTTKVYIGIETQPALVNNDFSNGLEGWTLKSVTEQSIEKENGINVLKFKPNATSYYSTRILKTFEYDASHIYYASVSLKSEGNTASDSTTNAFYDIFFGGMQIADGYEPTTQWKKFSGWGKITDDRFDVSAQDAGAYYMYFKDISLYDLTAMFGSGKEPNITWCNANLSNNSYIGEKARRVKKGYIGVNGVARLFYSTSALIPFTSNPVPTTWTDSSDYLSATAANEYGVWKVSADNTKWDNTAIPSYAFDDDTSTYYSSEAIPSPSTPYYLNIEMPSGVKINPNTIYIKHARCGNSTYPSYVQGYDGANWINLTKLQRSNGAVEETLDASSSYYFTKLRVALYQYSASYSIPSIYDFKITSGKLYVE